MGNIEVITSVTFLFFIYLVLALFVERAVEVIVAVYNYIECKFNLYRFWDHRTIKWQVRLERLYAYQSKSAVMGQQLLDLFLGKILAEEAYKHGKPIISASADSMWSCLSCAPCCAFLAFVVVCSSVCSA